jgi:hypothetical protein
MSESFLKVHFIHETISMQTFECGFQNLQPNETSKFNLVIYWIQVEYKTTVFMTI